MQGNNFGVGDGSTENIEREGSVRAEMHNGGGVVAKEISDQLNVKRQPGRIDVPCGTRHTNGV